jgi:hypothetical protein
VQSFWNKYRLSAIEIRTPATNTLLRRYQLNYGSAGAMNLLTSVQELGNGLSLPPIQFTYNADLPSYSKAGECDGADLCYGKVWLDTVTSEAGGWVNFNYTAPGSWRELNHDGPDGTAVWQNGQIQHPDLIDEKTWYQYRVREVTANPIAGLPMYTAYEYRNASNTNVDNGTWKTKDDKKEFYGHPIVRVFQRRGDAPDDHGPAVAYQDTWFHQEMVAIALCGQSVTDSNGLKAAISNHSI